MTVLSAPRERRARPRFTLGRAIVAGLILEAIVTGVALVVYTVLGKVWP